jgi:diguanylate cyclase (GGDEF)-like protein
VGRFGGDEFVIVCEDLIDDDGATEIAYRVLQVLEAPFATPSGDRALSVSIGVATCNIHNPMEADDLVRAADRAMYRAKMEGKARVEIAFHPPVAPALRPF